LLLHQIAINTAGCRWMQSR